MMSRERATILGDLNDVLRESAGRGLVLHQTIADRFGLGPSDLKCLDLVRQEPQLTAGRLAEQTGLSTSAVTSVIDRLERAGFVERVRGVRDRRRVYVRSSGRHEAAVAATFAQVAEAFDEILSGYGDDQLELIVGVMRRFNRASQDLTLTFRQREGAV